MATKPSDFPDWATTLENDPTSGQPNRDQPPTDKQDSGYDFEESPPRQWLNWKFWNLSEWTRWFDQEISGLGTAAQFNADQDLGTTDDVSFNSVSISGNNVPTEESQSGVALGGDFDGGITVSFSRAGDLCVCSADQASLTWTSGSVITSASGVIPSQFRPSLTFTMLFFLQPGAEEFYQATITSTGELTIRSLNSVGAAVSTTGCDAFSISYRAP